MINIHKRLIDAFATLPAVQDKKPNYKWGNEEHLNQLISAYGKDTTKKPYPLIYNISNSYTQNAQTLESQATLSLLIATKNENTSLLNNERWASSYDNILFPVARSIETLFLKSIIFGWDSEYELFEFPNYGQSRENETIDIWDALRFDTTITINDKCFKPIKY